MTLTRIAAALAAMAVVAMAGAAIYARFSGQDRFAQCRAGAIAGQSALEAAFSLTDETGRAVTEAEVLDVPALVYFGYTFCPDVCPIDSDRNATATAILDDQGVEVRPVFVSVDPGRDTPEVLAEFTNFYHERMLGLTGSAEAVDAAAKNFRVYYKNQQEADEEYYLVDHSSFTYLTLPGLGVADFFRRSTSPEEVAERTACFVSKL